MGNAGNDNELATEVHWIQHATFWSQIGLGVIGIAALCIYYGQLCEMKKATIAATAATKIASQSLTLDQRSWIGPVDVVGPKFIVDKKPSYVQAGQKMTLGVFISNSGRSPGLKVTIKDRLKATEAGEDFVPDYPPAKSNIVSSVSVVQPGMRMQLDSLPSEIQIFPQHIKKITEGTGLIYFYGEITYEDIFKSPHTTHFCLILAPDLQHLNTCRSYNDAD